MLSNVGPTYPLIFLSSIYKRRYVRGSLHSFPKLPGELVCFVIQGKGLLRIDHEVFPLQPGESFFLRPSMKLEAMLESAYADCYVLWLNRIAIGRRQGRWHASAADEDTAMLPLGRLNLRTARAILEQAAQLYSDWRARAKASGELQLQFQSLIRSMLLDLYEADPKAEAGKGIDQSIRYMHRHFREKIKLEALSRIAGLTQTSFSRSFKKAKGVTPIEYLNRIRIDHAKQLLKPDSSIKKVAEAVGYGSEFYFSRMFKRETGVTPTLYMRRRELRVAVATSFRFQDNLRALGAEPAAEMNGFKYPGQNEEEHRRLVLAQLSAMRQARPDLILADFRHVFFHEELKRIAPTVFLEYTMDWRGTHRAIAELVGRDKEAEQNFAQLEQKASYARQMLSGIIGSRTVTVARLYPDTIRLQGAGGHPLNELLYTELGLKPGSGVPLKEQNKEYPLAELPPFDTDYLFIYKYCSPEQEEEIFSQLRRHAFWNGMQAYRQRRIRVIANWIGMSWTPIGQHRIMDELLGPALSEDGCL